MKRVFCIMLLLSANITTWAQFNTIKKIKILPVVFPDTVEVAKDSTKRVINKPIATNSLKSSNLLTASMPLASPYINSSYGNRKDPLTGKIKFHAGLDFKSASDTVMVILPGKVSKVDYSPGMGIHVEVKHRDFTTIYGHLSLVLVEAGKELQAGAVIGLTGNTGRSTGDHLHFALKYKGRIVNPAPFLDEIYRATELHYQKKVMQARSN